MGDKLGDRCQRTVGPDPTLSDAPHPSKPPPAAIFVLLGQELPAGVSHEPDEETAGVFPNPQGVLSGGEDAQAVSFGGRDPAGTHERLMQLPNASGVTQVSLVKPREGEDALFVCGQPTDTIRLPALQMVVVRSR